MTVAPVTRPERVTFARLATASAFFVTGLVYATLFARIPRLKHDFGFSDGELGLALLVPPTASLVAMRFAGRLTARFGPGPVVRLAALLLPITLLGPALAHGRVLLVAALYVFGTVDGLIDVTMNAHAVALEKHLGRPLMSGFHASWSIGAIAGALGASMAAGAGWGLLPHFLTLAVLVVGTMSVLTRGLLSGAIDLREPRDELGEPGRRWHGAWSRTIVLLGLLSFGALLAEGAIGSWSAVFLTENQSSSSAVAALGYGMFNIMMTLGRLAGDRLSARVGGVRLVRYGGLLAVAGLGSGLASHSTVAAIVGFGLFGLGMAAVNPTIVSAVGHVVGRRVDAAAAVANVSTISYLGIFVGPPVIGWIAQVAGLRAALVVPIALTVMIMIGCRATEAAEPVSLGTAESSLS